jgi:hypothetical protein
MLKLSGFDTLFAVAGNLYLLLALAGVCLALWLGKTWLRKGVYAVLVLAAFIAPLVPEVLRQTEFRNRQATAKSMFEERCKTAGEKILRTVEGVEGIYLMKIRTSTNFGDQFELDDPYGHDSTGDQYLLNFLQGYYHQRNEKPVVGSPPRTGFHYIEAQDPKDSKRYRYTGGMKVVGQQDINHPNIQRALKLDPKYDVNNYGFVLDKAPAPGKRPRYGVTYDDISTREEREYWIAGSSLKVVDLETNEVIAERIGYMVDWAQGSRAGQRSPWLFAADNACPGFQWNPNFPVTRSNGGGSSQQPGQTITFVEKVLKPSK